MMKITLFFVFLVCKINADKVKVKQWQHCKFDAFEKSSTDQFSELPKPFPHFSVT